MEQQVPDRDPSSNKTQGSVLSWLVAHKALLALVLLYLLAIPAIPYISNQAAVRSWIEELGPLGPFIAFLLLVVGTVTLGISNDLLAVTTGSLFGFPVAFVLIWLSQFVGTLIGYFLVRNSVHEFSKASDWRQRIEGNRWLKRLARLPVDSPVFLIVGRWIPGYGGDIVYVLAGIYRVALWRLAWCTAISVTLPAIQFAALGTGLHLIGS